MKRTLENCRLVRKYGAPQQHNGICEGFAKSNVDDEPHNVCQKCKLHYLYSETEEL